MNTAFEQMLKNYQIENIYDQKNAMKEIMQEIVLCGLSRAFFFRKQPFMGERHSEFFMGCTIPESRHMLYERFDTFDFRQEKQDGNCWLTHFKAEMVVCNR